jgi:hypothetical protein
MSPEESPVSPFHEPESFAFSLPFSTPTRVGSMELTHTHYPEDPNSWEEILISDADEAGLRPHRRVELYWDATPDGNGVFKMQDETYPTLLTALRTIAAKEGILFPPEVWHRALRCDGYIPTSAEKLNSDNQQLLALAKHHPQVLIAIRTFPETGDQPWMFYHELPPQYQVFGMPDSLSIGGPVNPPTP